MDTRLAIVVLYALAISVTPVRSQYSGAIDVTTTPMDIPVEWGPITFDTATDKISFDVRTPAFDQSWADGDNDDIDEFYDQVLHELTGQHVLPPNPSLFQEYQDVLPNEHSKRFTPFINPYPSIMTLPTIGDVCVGFKFATGENYLRIAVVIGDDANTGFAGCQLQTGSTHISFVIHFVTIEWQKNGDIYTPVITPSTLVRFQTMHYPGSLFSLNTGNDAKLAILKTIVDPAIVSVAEAHLVTFGTNGISAEWPVHTRAYLDPSFSGLLSPSAYTVFNATLDRPIPSLSGLCQLLELTTTISQSLCVSTYAGLTDAPNMYISDSKPPNMFLFNDPLMNLVGGGSVFRYQGYCHQFTTSIGSLNSFPQNQYRWVLKTAFCDDGMIIQFYLLTSTHPYCVAAGNSAQLTETNPITNYIYKLTARIEASGTSVSSPVSTTSISLASTATITFWDIDYLPVNDPYPTQTIVSSNILNVDGTGTTGTCTFNSYRNLQSNDFDGNAQGTPNTGALCPGLDDPFYLLFDNLPGGSEIRSTYLDGTRIYALNFGITGSGVYTIGSPGHGGGTFCPTVVGSATPEFMDDSNFYTHVASEVGTHPVLLQYMDLSSSFLGPNNDGVVEHVPRTSDDLGTCATSFPAVTIAGVNDTNGFDEVLRDRMQDTQIYILPGDPSFYLFSPTQVHTGMPLLLSDASYMYPQFQPDSIVEGVTTSTEGTDHYLTWRFAQTLTQLRACKSRMYDGSLVDAMEIINPTPGTEFQATSFNQYSIYPTWVGLLPKRITGRRGGMVTSMRRIILRIFTTSRTVQIIDSGRRIGSEIIAVNPRVGTTFGCGVGEGRVEVIFEVAHGKENPDDNQEVIGIRHLSEIQASVLDPNYPNCYDFPVPPLDPLNQYQSLDQWPDTSICNAPYPQVVDLPATDSTNQFGGCPYCPENQGICYQRVVLTTQCFDLTGDADGRLFSSNDDCPRLDPGTTDGSTCGLGASNDPYTTCLKPIQDEPEGAHGKTNTYTGHYHLDFHVRVCNTMDDWLNTLGDGLVENSAGSTVGGDPLTRQCTDSHDDNPDQIQFILHDVIVQAEDDESDNRVRVAMEMALFREVYDPDFDADAISETTDFTNVADPGFVYTNNSHLIPRYTPQEKVTAAIRPRNENYRENYPIAIVDLWICKGLTVNVLAAQEIIQQDTAFDHNGGFCQGFTNPNDSPVHPNGLPVISNNVPTTLCQDTNGGYVLCIDEAQYQPKNLLDTIANGNSTFSVRPVCTGEISCDAIALDMDYIIRELGRTGKHESYMIDARVYVGEIELVTLASRRLLQSGGTSVDFENVGQIFGVDDAGNIFFTNVNIDCPQPEHAHQSTTTIEEHELMLLQKGEELKEAKSDEAYYSDIASFLIIGTLIAWIIWGSLLCCMRRTTHTTINNQKAVVVHHNDDDQQRPSTQTTSAQRTGVHRFHLN